MSATTANKLVYRVRLLIGAPSVTEGVPSLPAILDALDRAMFVVYSDLPGRASLNTAFLTLVAGTNSYALAESNPSALETFLLTSSGNPVYRKSLSELLGYRTGNPTSTGDPLIIAFAEAASGTVTAHVWPTPSKADTVQAVVDTMISSVFQGQASTDLSGVTLNFGPYGTRAIEYLAAAELLPKGDPSKVEYRETAAGLIYREACRIAAQDAGEGVQEPVI
jgi:hypothetical protein